MVLKNVNECGGQEMNTSVFQLIEYCEFMNGWSQYLHMTFGNTFWCNFSLYI